jgi:hypothetical protein
MIHDHLINKNPIYQTSGTTNQKNDQLSNTPENPRNTEPNENTTKKENAKIVFETTF